MRNGLVVQALRKNPWAFVGPACTQVLAATVVSGALAVQHSLDASPLTVAERHGLTESGMSDITTLFVTVSIYFSVLVIGVTMTSTIASQVRDIALARAIGARPGQVRRAVAVQAALVAIPSTVVGSLLGALSGRAWLHSLIGHGIVPQDVVFHAHPAALPISLVVTVTTSLLGALIAAIRPSRVRPAVAMSDSAAPPRGAGKIRTVIGVLLVAGGAVLSVVLAGVSAKVADQEGIIVMFALCVGTGFLAPALLRTAAPIARLFGNTGHLAADNIVCRAKSFSGAFVPLVLAAGFLTINMAQHTTANHVTGVDPSADDLWFEYAATVVYAAFGAAAALATLVMVVRARRRELAITRLIGATRGRSLAVVACEALVVTVTGLGTATAVTLITLMPLLHTQFGVWLPYLPPVPTVGVVVGIALVAVLGMAGPAAALLRAHPIEALGAES